MSTWNKSDLAQTGENVRRIRRDQLTDPGATPAAFIEPSGNVQAVPGDQAPFARVPPFATPFQAFGVPKTQGLEEVILFSPTRYPILNVTDWRKITLGLKYYVTGAQPGLLSIVPFYGQSRGDDYYTDDLYPRMVPSDVLTVDGVFAYRTMYEEQFRTPLVSNSIIDPYRMYITLDVSEFTAFTISALETSELLTCNPEDEEPLCSVVEFTYSLSM